MIHKDLAFDFFRAGFISANPKNWNNAMVEIYFMEHWEAHQRIVELIKKINKLPARKKKIILDCIDEFEREIKESV